MIQRLRLSRTRAVLAALVIGLAVGSMTQTSNQSLTLTVSNDRTVQCGTYPAVALRRDCARVLNYEKHRGIHRNPLLACIRSIETGGRYTALSPHGTYRGAYQFRISTWQSVGAARFDAIDPVRAPRWLQDVRAQRLMQLRGLAPWPSAQRCGRTWG